MASKMISDLHQPSNRIDSTTSHDVSVGLNGNGEFPSLLSDEEIEALQLSHNRSERAEQDKWDNKGIVEKPVVTDGLPESTLEQRFMRIAKKLVSTWPSEACALYINKLVISERESREGFPQEVIDDLMMLYEINDMLLQKPELNSPSSKDYASASPHTSVSEAAFNWNSIDKNGCAQSSGDMEQPKELRKCKVTFDPTFDNVVINGVSHPLVETFDGPNELICAFLCGDGSGSIWLRDTPEVPATFSGWVNERA